MEKSLPREYLEALLIAVVFATFARTFLVQAFKIPSGSMEQNLLIGDHILVNKFVYGPAGGLGRAVLPARAVRRGDVVVFKFPDDPSRDFIKRCIGLPGDTVEVQDKVLFLNGEQVHDEGYVYHFDDQILPRSELLAAGLRNRDNFGPFQVPEESYFCMGDNRDNSNDSRFWGTVPASNVKGRAFLVYWSNAGEVAGAGGALGEGTDHGDGGSRLRRLGRAALRFFTDTRWNRSFRVVR
jgi:signal peptidase I